MKNNTNTFHPINRGYNHVFRANKLSLGLVVPIENYANSAKPTMKDHIKRVQLAENLGFSSVWLRDVPFNVPSFGDAGQLYDPFVYLGLLAATTEKIALGVASIVLPLRHPAHVAKSAASADDLSEGRVILGIASGDRPDEYPALNKSYENRGQRFRDSFEYIRRMADTKPAFDNTYGHLNGDIDLLPKPASGQLPLLITGGSQQSPEWVAQQGDGWMTYPRNIAAQAKVITDYRANTQAATGTDKPIMQPLYLDLAEDPSTPPQPIHLGLYVGTQYLLSYLKSLEDIGINHIALNLRFNEANIETTLRRLADDILPHFSRD